jgi:hypothetical protein
MAKKLLLVLFLFCIIGSNNIWAWENPEFQGLLIGLGISFVALPWLMGSEDETTNTLCYAGGGLLIGGGILWMILDIAINDITDARQKPDGIYLASGEIDHNQVLQKTENRSAFDLLKHIYVGIAKDKYYLGLSYSY